MGLGMRKPNLTLAILLGISLPLGETIRRWGTNFLDPRFFDDYILGGSLLFGAWRMYTKSNKFGVLLIAWIISSLMRQALKCGFEKP
jgi:hypothetical protein